MERQYRRSRLKNKTARTSAMLVAMTHLRVPGGAGSKMRVCGGLGFTWEVHGR